MSDRSQLGWRRVPRLLSCTDDCVWRGQGKASYDTCIFDNQLLNAFFRQKYCDMLSGTDYRFVGKHCANKHVYWKGLKRHFFLAMLYIYLWLSSTYNSHIVTNHISHTFLNAKVTHYFDSVFQHQAGKTKPWPHLTINTTIMHTRHKKERQHESKWVWLYTVSSWTKCGINWHNSLVTSLSILLEFDSFYQLCGSIYLEHTHARQLLITAKMDVKITTWEQAKKQKEKMRHVHIFITCKLYISFIFISTRKRGHCMSRDVTLETSLSWQ